MIAVAATAGVDPLVWIRGDNEIEFALLERVVQKTVDLQRKIRKEQAALIINALASSLSKGKSLDSGRNTSSTRRGLS
jgi:hypothetical protein